MNALLERINSLNIEDRDKQLINAADITEVVYHKLSGSLTVYLHAQTPLPFDTYKSLTDALATVFKLEVELIVKADEPLLKIMELHKYLKHFIRKQRNADCLNSAMPSLKGDVLELLFSNEREYLASKELSTRLKDFYEDCGILLGHIDYSLRVVETVVDEKKVEVVETKTEDKFLKKKTYRPNSNKKEDYTPIQLKDSMIPMENICFEADIFNVEEQITKNDRMIQTLSASDGSGAILIKRFEGKMNTREDLAEIKNGAHVKVYGNIQYDNFTKDYVCMPRAIEKLDKPKIVDNAEIKRVELHCHTTMSEMDAVCDINDVISFAFNMGYEGIAITDHAGTQAFAKAHRKASGLVKGSDRKFKVMYGCEMNMVDENLTIIRNGTDGLLDDQEYICFDLETTGLSCYFDHIIEFGAVKIKNQAVIDRKQLFVKPPVQIPYFISEKTNITNDMVKDAKPFNEVIDEILEWIGDAVLVAHNATFDYGFLNEELRRIGRAPLTNVVIDTLDFARAIHSDRRSYRLGNVARLYRISYDEEVAHRADYDAEVLADVYMAMVRDAKKLGAKTINDLQRLQSDQAFAKMRKNHIIVMAKNQKGIRALYQLVTISNTKSLALFGKANGKNGEEFLSEPRIFRRVLQENRADLVFGSACFNSEVWECAANRNDADLAKAISFYDYIELQPLNNYSTLIQMNSIPSEERLKQIQMRIIKEAQRQHKPVVATGDVHYLTPDQKLFRDIYIATQGVGGVRHPLYVYNAELRKKIVNPDQHFRTTQEMLDAFSWIEDRDLVEEIVITNSRRIMDCIEPVQPVQDGTFPPIIEGSDQKLTDICFETAHKVYGEVLPEIVQKRLERELKSIIENGYAVVYYISHLLVKKSNEDGYLVGSRGSVGSSFVATMSGITEVNPLQAHYICPHCHHSEWLEKYDGIDGYDLDDKECPKCHKMMKGNGHNIPFETFLGFKGDKVPDIDLNFSNEYQAKAHAFTKEVFGEDHVFRAGTIGTVAEKTAYGYVTGYCEEMGLENMRKVQKDFLAKHCEGIKRTTGQHPGGIIVVPSTYDAAYFTPVQFPANDPSSEWKTTHLDFHDIHDNVLKFDILGHVDPTAMRLLENVSGIDPKTIPMNDPATMSLFSSADALNLDTRVYSAETGALGLPEFGTKITRGVLEQTRPKNFRDLVIISGLTHGTDVWAGNASDLVAQGIPLDEVIGCRDDIMTYLISKNMESVVAFTIMESVRKGKGLKPEWEVAMREHDVPEWYIESCKKIKYMFPKAHAVAYVLMAVRIAWFKVHLPHYFYIQFLTLRCDAYEIETMSKGIEAIQSRMTDIQSRMNNRNVENPASQKEKWLCDTLEVCLEIYARGYRISNVDLYKSKATQFSVVEGDEKVIIPPFSILDGLGDNVAKSIEKAREQGEFLSKEDLKNRTQLSDTLIKKLDSLGCLKDLQERNQISLF